VAAAGAGSATFTISTTAALVAAAAGTPVAKHGNRAITSKSGSADVLDALGVRIDHDAESAGAALRDISFAFMFAPGFHPAMKHAGPTRREIGVRTAFNLIGPLTNPAGAARRAAVGGAATAGACGPPGPRAGVGGGPEGAPAARLAAVLERLGVDRAFVVGGEGIDELPLDGTGVITDIRHAGTHRCPGAR